MPWEKAVSYTHLGRAYRWYYVAYDLKPDGHYNSLSSLNTLDAVSYTHLILPNPIKPTFIFMVGEY